MHGMLVSITQDGFRVTVLIVRDYVVLTAKNATLLASFAIEVWYASALLWPLWMAHTLLVVLSGLLRVTWMESKTFDTDESIIVVLASGLTILKMCLLFSMECEKKFLKNLFHWLHHTIIGRSWRLLVVALGRNQSYG